MTSFTGLFACRPAHGHSLSSIKWTEYETMLTPSLFLVFNKCGTYHASQQTHHSGQILRALPADGLSYTVGCDGHAVCCGKRSNRLPSGVVVDRHNHRTLPTTTQSNIHEKVLPSEDNGVSMHLANRAALLRLNGGESISTKCGHTNSGVAHNYSQNQRMIGQRCHIQG